MQGQDDKEAAAKSEGENGNNGVRGAVAKEPMHFGWPELQIDILRQCIAIAEALPGISTPSDLVQCLDKYMYLLMGYGS